MHLDSLILLLADEVGNPLLNDGVKSQQAQAAGGPNAGATGGMKRGNYTSLYNASLLDFKAKTCTF